MLDFHTSTTALHPALIDTIYTTAVDEADLDAALRAVRDFAGAAVIRLIRAGRGEEILLGEVGTLDADERPARELRVDGPISDIGRRLVLEAIFDRPEASLPEELWQSLLGHIERAVALSTRIGSTDMERNIESELLGRLSVGTIFLDSERNVVSMTGTANALVGSGDCLRLRGGMIAACCGTEDRELQAAIKAALTHPEDGPSDVLRVQHVNCERALGIVVQPIHSTARTGGIACALVIRDSERPCAPEQEMLRKLFDLTPAEANLTSILSSGMTLDEASAELSISRNTARAHLRAIFSKCGINRQTELVRLVLTSVAMLGASPDTLRAA